MTNQKLDIFEMAKPFYMPRAVSYFNYKSNVKITLIYF